MSHTHRNSSTASQNKSDGGLTGVVLANHRLLRVIGRGGMGLVFEGEHIHTQKRVAVKVVHAELSRSEQVAARFQRESRCAASSDHPGVVRVFDTGQTPDGLSYIVMEYLDGVLLAQRLNTWYGGDRDSPMPRPISKSAPAHAERALHIAWQIADTLYALHRIGIVHRDLKPENIFLITEDGAPDRERAKIFDFGIAKFLANSDRAFDSPFGSEAMGPAEGDLPAPVTKIGTVLGTPLYMSPEQWQGQGKISERADVYSAGCIFFELFTGVPPFRSQVLGQLLLSHMHQPAPLLSDCAPWIPIVISELIERMLKKDPALRPTMDEVAECFERQLAPTRTVAVVPQQQSGVGIGCMGIFCGPSVVDAVSALVQPNPISNPAARVLRSNPPRPEAPCSIPPVRSAPHSVSPGVGSAGFLNPVSSGPIPLGGQQAAPSPVAAGAMVESPALPRGPARPAPSPQSPTRLVPVHSTILSGPVQALPLIQPPPAMVPPPPAAPFGILAVCALGLILTSVAAILMQGS